MYTFTPPGTLTMADYYGSAYHRASLTLAHLEAVLVRVSSADVRLAAVELATTWTDRAFLAETYRRGRVLLAGDAPHIHAPLGGQGLNLGIGDAVELSGRLVATVLGGAGLDGLDGYESARRPVAKAVLDWSRAHVALMRPDPGAAALRAVVRDLMETRDGATWFARRTAGGGLGVADAA